MIDNTKIHLIRVKDEDYSILKDISAKDCRSIPNEISYIIRKFAEGSGTDAI